MQALKHEITSFEPSFKRGIEISNKLLSEKLVDPDRVESYEDEVKSLENRWKQLQQKQIGNGTT